MSRSRFPHPPQPGWTSLRIVIRFTLLLVSLSLTGCYHFRFERLSKTAVASPADVVHEIRRPTYLNGFIGTGTVDVSRYCPNPVRTELRVTGTDVLLSAVTLLIYTPHTLYVTCPGATSPTAEAPLRAPEAAEQMTARRRTVEH